MTDNDPGVVNLTPELVSTGAARVHTYESFGRAIIGQALRAAAKSETLGTDAATIPTEITIRSSTTEDRGPVLRSGCIDVCILDVCVHVEWQ